MFVRFIPIIDNDEIRKFRLEWSQEDVAFATINKNTGKFTYEGYRSPMSSTNPYKIEELARKTLQYDGNDLPAFSYGVG